MRSTPLDSLYTVSRATIGCPRLVTLLKQDALLAIDIFTKKPCKLWCRLQMESIADKLCLSKKVRAILMGQGYMFRNRGAGSTLSSSSRIRRRGSLGAALWAIVLTDKWAESGQLQWMFSQPRIADRKDASPDQVCMAKEASAQCATDGGH
jgi:hypothetical protein